MKKCTWVILMVGMAVGLAGGVRAAELGSPAPPLQIAEWVKGDAVDLASGGGKQVYVVEFWATWCPPCRESIPHLTEVQKQYQDKGVIVVGISDESPATAKRFVEKMGDEMDYTVAVDQNRLTSAAYLEAFGAPGIPYAFVVDTSGAIVWHGHPMEGLEDVLDAVLGGTFDPAAQALRSEMRELTPLWAMEYLVLAKYGRDTKAADEVGQKLVTHGSVAPEILNEVAWRILEKEEITYQNLPTALAMAKMAHDATSGEDASVVDTYARALFENGHVAEAVQMQRDAIARAKADAELKGDARLIHELEENLKRYETPAATP